VRGFFNATQRRVLAHVSWGALKKTNSNYRFEFERLWVSRTNEEVDVVDNPSEGKSNHSGDDNAQHWQSRSRYTGKC
jgi:hypothetical protein